MGVPTNQHAACDAGGMLAPQRRAEAEATGGFRCSEDALDPKGIERVVPLALEQGLKAKVTELARQPEFRWQDGQVSYGVDADGTPAARVAVANCELAFDLWKDLRNPATIGLYPVGFREIWDFHAHNRKRKTDESGRSTIFQVAESFESAAQSYRRVVVTSTMLAAAPAVFARYNRRIDGGGLAPWDGYAKVWDELNTLLDRGTTRLAFELVRDGRAVVVMNQATVSSISKEAMPLYHQDASHGVCKGGNFPVRSVAVLTGLGQFGVSRNVFRDEEGSGGVRRLAGPIRCIVLFDQEQAYSDPKEEILLLAEEWREKVRKLSDFTVTDSRINRYRFCPYIPETGESGCTTCLTACPSGALPNSTPQPDGRYGETVARQRHCFWKEALQFDKAKCIDHRQQHSALYAEWACGRCLVSCAANGRTRDSSVRGNKTFRFDGAA